MEMRCDRQPFMPVWRTILKHGFQSNRRRAAPRKPRRMLGAAERYANLSKVVTEIENYCHRGKTSYVNRRPICVNQKTPPRPYR